MRAPNHRILVVAPHWIGDALLAQPLFARLHGRATPVTIDALAPPWTAPALRRMPEIGSVIEAPFAHGELALGKRWRLGRALRSRRYDEAIVLPNSFKSALVPCFAGIARRVGFVGEARYGLLNVTHQLDAAKQPLMAERYAALAGDPGAPIGPLQRARLVADEANLVISIGRLGLSRAKPVVAFCPGAEYGPAKRWPVHHFAALAQLLAERGRSVWLFGSAKEREIGAEIVALAEGARVANLCGRTDLASAIDLLSAAEAVVSNDSGLMHVAAALDRPLVALYGSSSPAHTPPLSTRARIVYLGVECSPCFQRECPLGHFKCMNELAPERVLAELEALRETDRLRSVRIRPR